jgi:beta-lactamase regulating signal transducer with metallopeptidase domain
MAWHIPIWNWLIHAALGGLFLLAGGCLAARLCRQPVRRLRVIELTLLACLVVPWLHLVPGLPQWSLGWVASAQSTTRQSAPASEAIGIRFQDQERLGADSREQPSQASSSATVGSRAPSEAGQFTGSLSLPQMLVFAYLLLSAGVLIWWLLGLLKLVWLYRSTYPATSNVLAVLRQIAGPGAERVELCASDQLELPLTFTWRRPIIVLPGSLCRDGDESSLRYCLAHEWSHIERRDIWIWQATALAQVLFFYQPLFWWLRHQLRLCQDYLADFRAAGQAQMAEDYAEFLVGLAWRRLGNPLPAALGIGDRWSNLHWRILMLINFRQTLEPRCRGL